MANGRCRLHGGKSTGPRTPEGLERSRRARLVHGYYTAEAKAARAEARRTMRELQLLLREAGAPTGDVIRVRPGRISAIGPDRADRRGFNCS